MSPTPDFYQYDARPVAQISVEHQWLRLDWEDGAHLAAHALWLFENTVGIGTDVSTREGLVDPANLRLDMSLCDAVADVTGARIVVTFDDALDASFHTGWLHHVATGQHKAEGHLPSQVPWTTSDFSHPPSHDGGQILGASEALIGWVNDLLTFGVARLQNAPLDPDFGLRLGEQLGAIRDTNFGPIWDVRADVDLAGRADTNSTANTTLRLGPHTDLPTRETPPGFQFLHCIANETKGGWSTIADGQAVVDALQSEHPEHYDALTTLRWIFFNRGPGIDHRWSGPIIDLGVTGSPLTIRAFYPVRGFPDMDPVDVPRAYAAMKVFSQLASSPRFEISFPFTPGDVLAFDNRRMLHGRTEFTAGGRRHLRGIYIDHDDVRSFARASNRRRQPASSGGTI